MAILVARRRCLKTSADDDVFAFMKEKNGSTVVVILNLSDEPQKWH